MNDTVNDPVNDPVNDTDGTPENLAGPQGPETPDGAAPPEADAPAADGPGADAPGADAPGAGAPEDAAPSADDASEGEHPASEGTSLYVRRGRTPTLGFWVALAIVLPALGALLSAPLFDFADLSGVLNFMLVAAVFVGLPLAAIAALVDSLMHRGEKRSRR